MVDFEELYSHYFMNVYKYSYSLAKNEKIAEDITQETFLKAIQKIESFKHNCSMEAWLCLIAKNTYYDLYRKNKRLQEFDVEIKVESFESKLVHKEQSFEIHKLLHKLEEPYKEVFSLRLFGELSFAQIGELFERNENWARITFHRAKLKIQVKLDSNK